MWFRRDLRLDDNPALGAAISASGGNIICLYILEDLAEGRALGGASKWWLDKSLRSLRNSIERAGGTLTLRAGGAKTVLDSVITETDAKAVFWNRRYEQPGRDVDTEIKAHLKESGVSAESFNGTVLTEPWTQKTGSGGYYKVYSPYWRAVQANYELPAPVPAPSKLSSPSVISDNLEDWGLHPSRPDWST
ncbi:MAG: deoxyribodipyrimidine photo-lyase, partial [Pseudomonadota bacterium]